MNLKKGYCTFIDNGTDNVQNETINEHNRHTLPQKKERGGGGGE